MRTLFGGCQGERRSSEKENGLFPEAQEGRWRQMAAETRRGCFDACRGRKVEVSGFAVAGQFLEFDFRHFRPLLD